MTSTLCQARRPRLPLAAGRERHGYRSGVVGDAQRGWWMNGGGGCEVYWLLTWVGNSNHPCQNGYGSIPINTIFSGMNIHLPAILMWTTGVLLVLTHCQMSKPIEYNGLGPRMVKLFFFFKNEQLDGPSETSFSDPTLLRFWAKHYPNNAWKRTSFPTNKWLLPSGNLT